MASSEILPYKWRWERNVFQLKLSENLLFPKLLIDRWLNSSFSIFFSYFLRKVPSPKSSNIRRNRKIGNHLPISFVVSQQFRGNSLMTYSWTHAHLDIHPRTGIPRMLLISLNCLIDTIYLRGLPSVSYHHGRMCWLLLTYSIIPQTSDYVYWTHILNIHFVELLTSMERVTFRLFCTLFTTILCFPFPGLCRKLQINKILGNWSLSHFSKYLRVYFNELFALEQIETNWPLYANLARRKICCCFPFGGKTLEKDTRNWKENKIELKLTVDGGSVGASRT